MRGNASGRAWKLCALSIMQAETRLARRLGWILLVKVALLILLWALVVQPNRQHPSPESAAVRFGASAQPEGAAR